jgi:DNA primase
MLDGDDGGAQAVLRAAALARPAGLEVLVASLPAGSDPAALLQRDGAGAVRQCVAAASAVARFRVRHHVQRADLGTAEGKDRLVSELRAVFADIPSSALREDLIACVAERLALPAALVSSWLPRTESATEAAAASFSAYRERTATERTTRQRSMLVRCLADPQAAAALAAEAALEEQFPDALARRAAEHIRAHAANPTADLPDDDHELVAYITGLLSAAISAPREP